MKLTPFLVQLWDVRWNPGGADDIRYPSIVGYHVHALTAQEALTFAIEWATDAIGATIASSDPLVTNMETGEEEIG